MNLPLLDLYTDYLIASTAKTTATGLEKATGGSISHDKITSFLSEEDFTSQHLWRLTKSTVRRIETDEGIIIIDDTIEEKPYTDENELITWHYDHSLGKRLKASIFLVLCILVRECLSPLAFSH
jgi:hypothetical protein